MPALPVPRQELAASPRAAVAAARRLGFPVVVKPVGASGGSGAATGLADAQQVVAAFARAAAVFRPVLVERMLPGEDHWFLDIGGKLVSVVRKEAASVTGDGRLTLAAPREAADAETRGDICEVNHMSGALIHLSAEGGTAPPVEAFLRHWLDGVRPALLVVVVGDAAVCRLKAELTALGVPTGLAAAAGLRRRRPAAPRPRPLRRGRLARLLYDPSVAVAVAAVPPEALCRQGVGHDRVDLAIDADGEPLHLAEAMGMPTRIGAASCDLLAQGQDRFPRDAAARLAERARTTRKGRPRR